MKKLSILLLLPFLFLANALIAQENNVQAAVDSLKAIIEANCIKLYGITPSEAISESSYVRFPVELDFIFVDGHKITEIISRLEALQHDGFKFRVFAFTLTTTAESRREDGKNILSSLIIGNLYQGKSGDLANFTSPPLMEALKNISFETGIKRKEKVPGIDMWYTSIHQSGSFGKDKKLALTGYSFRFGQVVELMKSIGTSIPNSLVTFHSLNSTNYSGFPLFKFELRIESSPKEPLPMHYIELFEAIDKIVAEQKRRIASVRVAPPIKVKGKIGLPVQISFENLITSEWDQLKSALEKIETPATKVVGVSDQGLTDAGFTLRMKVVVEP